MSTVTRTEPAARLLTIGAVCGRLREEFEDISISKIRYLEDQGSGRRSARAAATACSVRTTSSACRRSCACSATSSCRCA